MITKHYTSRSVLSFNSDGMEINFERLTDGGSYLITTDKTVIAAVEKHHWFNVLFALKSVTGEEETETQETATAAADEAGAADENTEAMCFDTVSDAREWLNSRFGVAVRNVKSRQNAVEIAAQHGVSLTFKE
ncbi:MAG: hypothetical protein HUK08_09250 [Bacteroidaceae bacterium]|nr:hypothetical protein [Bacteroidaceae bacterium]